MLLLHGLLTPGTTGGSPVVQKVGVPYAGRSATSLVIVAQPDRLIQSQGGVAIPDKGR